MLKGVILIVKVNWKNTLLKLNGKKTLLKLTEKKTCSLHTAIFLNKVNLIEMTNKLKYYSLLKRNVAAAVLPTYTDQTSILPTTKFSPVLNK